MTTSSSSIPLRPDWAIDQPSHTSLPWTAYSLVPLHKVLLIASSSPPSLNTTTVSDGLSIKVFARYCPDSEKLWIGVYKRECTPLIWGPWQGCKEEFTWMPWPEYVRSEVAGVDWMRAEEAYCRLGKLSRKVVVERWLDEEERGTWQGSEYFWHYV
ncbi:hypothetical protein K505DRAFT_366758 [Melanomma pulvis-pyrius CBS 109.77]|uniref:Uncharacterized protein n=1 Tax=Melanomma pulvis-pyrius CBS 109.77 TaxID=1314802 RepID=A0A6A6WW09_9PLEO|nr:hypothetical protein K505DRAFT_366758 [Melanomma pulvis-pyrius CBS 109.77]